jgi:hypothetical protein
MRVAPLAPTSIAALLANHEAELTFRYIVREIFPEDGDEILKARHTGAPTFVYGTIDSTSGAVLTTNTGLPGSGYSPDGAITLVVPKSDIGNPAPGSLLANLRARTFALQGDASALTAASADTTAVTPYSVVGNDYCQ